MIKVTPIHTGTAVMKTLQKAGRDGRSAVGRKIDIFRDPNWVDPLPVLAFLIEHPEGRFIVDTGDTWRNAVPGYLPWWNPFFTTQVQIKVAPLEEIGPRLQAMGLDPARDIAAVILTHFHHDHTGGLDHFPHDRIIASRENYEASRGFKGKLMGCLPQRWPVWLKPDLVDLTGPAVGPFAATHPITADGSRRRRAIARGMSRSSSATTTSPISSPATQPIARPTFAETRRTASPTIRRFILRPCGRSRISRRASRRSFCRRMIRRVRRGSPPDASTHSPHPPGFATRPFLPRKSAPYLREHKD